VIRGVTPEESKALCLVYSVVRDLLTHASWDYIAEEHDADPQLVAEFARSMLLIQNYELQSAGGEYVAL